MMQIHIATAVTITSTLKTTTITTMTTRKETITTMTTRKETITTMTTRKEKITTITTRKEKKTTITTIIVRAITEIRNRHYKLIFPIFSFYERRVMIKLLVSL